MQCSIQPPASLDGSNRLRKPPHRQSDLQSLRLLGMDHGFLTSLDDRVRTLQYRCRSATQLSAMHTRIYSTRNAVEALLALPFLQSIDRYYPDLQHWFINTVLPGLQEGSSVLLLAKDHHAVVGMALGKTGSEKKLRCVRTNGHYNGLGLRLMERMFETIECDKPHCTVSEELLGSYSRAFVNRYGFDLHHVSKGEYRPGKLEYHFN